MHLLSPSQKIICLLFGFLVFFNAVEIQAEEDINEDLDIFDEFDENADIDESSKSKKDGSKDDNGKSKKNDDGSDLKVGDLSCADVYDGRGDDVDTQTSKTVISGNWKKFSDKDDSKVDYEYAVVSEGAAPSYVRGYVLEKKKGKDKKDTKGKGKNGKDDKMNEKRVPVKKCFTSERDIHPDVVDFTKPNKTGDRWFSNMADLVVGYKYFVIVKAQMGKDTIYSHSDGVIVVNGTGGGDDDDNDDDDDVDLGLGIGLGLGLGLCLLLLLLLLIVVARGKGEDKYTTTVHRNENVDKI
jgi:hypothetical protein